ncbi:hypothetical protein D3C77_603730 [compost metagenome]
MFLKESMKILTAAYSNIISNIRNWNFGMQQQHRRFVHPQPGQILHHRLSCMVLENTL